MRTSGRLTALWRVALVVPLAGIAVGVAPAVAHAGTTITVNTTLDDQSGPIGKCTLRDAINAANTDKAVDACPAGSGTDTIIVPSGTYTVTQAYGLPQITTAMNIIGTGPATVVQLGNDFEVMPGGSLNISKMTTAGGTLENAAGTLHIADMTVRDSHGIFGGVDNTGTLTIVTSTIMGNSGWSGGISIRGGSVIAVNDTITNNTAERPGGTGQVGGGIECRDGSFRGRNLTITNNTAFGRGVPDSTISGGIDARCLFQLANSIVAGNKVKNDPAGPPDCTTPSGPLTSLGYNLIGSAKGCTMGGTKTGNVTNTAAKLGALANNGGPTQTMLPLTGSPAIDHGNPAAPGQQPALCPLLDQRGVARPRDGNADGIKRCDIGAVER